MIRRGELGSGEIVRWAVVPALVAVLVLAAVGVAPQPAAAATLVVDDDGVECSAAGYSTIQAAVDAASAGDVIEVCTGTYDEDVDVTTSVTIVANGTAVLDGGNTLANGFDVDAPGVTIRGLAVGNYTDNAIDVRGVSTGFLLDDATVRYGQPATTSSRSGVFFGSVDGVTVTDTTFVGDVAGFAAVLGQRATNVTLTGNVVTSPRSGFQFSTFSDDAVVTDNDVTVTGTASTETGIFLRDSDRATVRNNTVSVTATARGIYAFESAGHLIEDNTVRGGSTGVLLGGGTTAGPTTVRNNDVAGAEFGIGASASSGSNAADGAVIVDNVVDDIGEDGVTVRGATGVTVTGNAVSRASQGVVVSQSDDVEVSNNRVSDSRIGVILSSGDRYRATDNDLTVNGLGVDLNSATNVTVERNRIDGVGSASRGIDVDGGTTALSLADNVVTGVTVTGSAFRTFTTVPVSNLTTDSATVDLTALDASINAVSAPPSDPPGEENIGQYLEASSLTTGGYVDLTVRYTDADVAGVDESTLSLWVYNGASWSEVPGSAVDTAANTVSANLTSLDSGGFTYAPLATPTGPVQVDDCFTIEQPGVYELTRNITQTAEASCIVINASDVTLDGNGFTVDYTGAAGNDRAAVDAGEFRTDRSNVTVRNVVAVGFDQGVVFRDVDDALMENIVTRDNRFGGAVVEGGNRVTVRNVDSTNDGFGIDVTGSDHVVSDAVVRSARYGINTARGSVAGTTFSDIRITDSTTDIRLGQARDPVFSNVTLDSARIVDLRGAEITISSVASPPADPAGQTNVGQYVEARDLFAGDGNEEMNLTLAYDEAALGGADEATLTMWNYDAATAAWTPLAGSSVDTAANTVSVTATDFSVFAPLASTAVGNPVTGCRVIDAPGVYTLTGDIVNATADPCIQVAASDVVLDGAGFTMDGVDDDATGVLVGGALIPRNVTVENLVLVDWNEGVLAGGATTVRNNLFESIGSSSGRGVEVTSRGAGSVVDGNTFANHSARFSEAIRVSGGGTVVSNNEIRDGTAGINVFSTRNVQVLNNRVSNMAVNGISVTGFTSNVTLVDNVVVNSGDKGIRLYRNDGPTFVRDTVLLNNSIGISIEGAENAVIRNTTANGNALVFRTTTSGTSTSGNNTVEELGIDATTVLSFRARHLELRTVASPPADPAGRQNIGQYVEATALASGTSYFDGGFEYDDADLAGAGLDETTLRLWSYDGTTWTEVPGSVVDTGANDVSGNVTSFSVLAPLAAPGSDTTPPTVSNFDASNPSGQVVRVAFDADESLADVEVRVTDATGTTVATLTEADFAVSGNTYTASVDVGADGTFTATLLRAADAAGNDGATGQSDTVVIDTAAATPVITGFEATNPSGQTVQVRFDSTEPLDDIEVQITDDATLVVVATLTEADFSVSGSTYTASVDVGADGDFAATLLRGANANGDGATGQSDGVTVDTLAPELTNLRVSNPDGRTVRVGFDASKPLAEIRVTVTDVSTGDVVATLTGADLARSGARYTGSVEVPVDGRYRVTVERALDAAGREGGAGQSALLTVDSRFPGVFDFRLTNPRDTLLEVSFRADEPLERILVVIDDDSDPRVRPRFSLLAAIFDVEDGRYTATLNVEPGNYTGVLRRAEDANGNDGARGERDAVTIPPGTTDTTPPSVLSFGATAADGRVEVRVAADEPLAERAVEVTDADGTLVATLTGGDFEMEAGEYVARTGSLSPGTYTATLVQAADAAGNDGASGETATATVADDDRSVADYENDQGRVDTAGLQRAIEDWAANRITTDLLQDVIAAWASDAA